MEPAAQPLFEHRWVRAGCPFRPLGAAPDAVQWREKFLKCIDTLRVPGENLPIPPITPIPAKCRHPQVRVVAHDEDTEFVECQRCGEVFDADEYRDMMLEEEELKRAAEQTADSA